MPAPWSTGGYFDPLGLTSGGDEARTFKLKEAELKHGRLAMVAFLGDARPRRLWDLANLASWGLNPGVEVQGGQ